MLIGITGFARHGKDTAANVLVEKFGFTKLGFADAVREMAEAIDPYVNTGMNRHFTEGDSAFARYTDVLRAVGYETAKGYSDVRRLLQRIGTEAGRKVLGDDVWVDAMVRKIGALTTGFPLDADIVINDVRFENEAKMIHDLGGYVIRVTRPNFDNGLPPLHPSETAIATLDVDREITTESFDELQQLTEHVYASLREDDIEKLRQLTSFTSAPTKVYLAAPWVCKAEAAVAKQQLLDAGFDVVSGWTERENTPPEVEPTIMSEQAALDRDEVQRADVLVLLGLAKSEGKACELGMALALGKRAILVKADRIGNIFYHLPEVERVDTLGEAITLLGGTVRDYAVNTTPAPAAPPAPTGGFYRTLDPVTGKPLPGTPWDGLPVEPVPQLDEHDLHDLARHAGESGKD